MQERFWQACQFWGDETTVRDLVRRGVDINCRDGYGWCGLYWAVYYGHNNIAKFLLSLPQIDVNGVTNNHRRTALHVATRAYNMEIVSELLKRNDIRLYVKDSGGETAKEMAVERGSQEIIRMIEKKEADRGGARGGAVVNRGAERGGARNTMGRRADNANGDRVGKVVVEGAERGGAQNMMERGTGNGGVNTR